MKEEAENVKEGVEKQPLAPINSDEIKAVASLIDEFNNIVAKNFSVYGSQDDFSFANSRSTEIMEQKL